MTKKKDKGLREAQEIREHLLNNPLKPGEDPGTAEEIKKRFGELTKDTATKKEYSEVLNLTSRAFVEWDKAVKRRREGDPVSPEKVAELQKKLGDAFLGLIKFSVGSEENIFNSKDYPAFRKGLNDLNKLINKIATSLDLPKLAKVGGNYLNAYFTTDETLKNYQGQLEFDLSSGQDIAVIKEQLQLILSEGFQGIDLSYFQNRTMKGVFSLLEKQGASEDKPFIFLKNISQLYEEVLERKVKKHKGDRVYLDFSGQEVTQVDEALDALSLNSQQVLIKTRDGVDKKGNALYAFYMSKKPLISVEYLKRKVSEEEAKTLTEEDLKKTGEVRIFVLPILMRDYNKYFKIMPIDISKEVREACPEIKKISEPIINFIDYLHRQDNLEVRRERITIIKALRLEKDYKKNKGRTVKTLFKCYDIAKRTGYLEDYKTDQKGKLGKVDVLYLNPGKYYHFNRKLIALEEAREGITDETTLKR
jgi:hypothetical protein